MIKSETKTSVLIYLVLALAVLCCFWQVRNFDFVNYDDNLYVYENPHVLNGLTFDDIAWAFTTPQVGNWLPLTWLSLMLDCQLFGSDPHWMHFVNLLLHLANTLLLFAVLKKVTDSLWPSAFVAAAFALHPMHVESVAWITERKDVLSTFFFLLILAAYVGYARRGGLFRYLLTISLFMLGLLAKPMLIIVPLVLLLLDYWPLNRFAGTEPLKTSFDKKSKPAPAVDKRTILTKILIEKIPFFVLAAISSAITFTAQKAGGNVTNAETLPLQHRIANALVSYVTYIGKMLWPQNLAAFYPFNADIPFWQIALSILLLIIISAFVIRFGRKQEYFLVGWFWFILTLLPVIGFIQSGAQSLADRYTYIPYIGLFIIIAWALPDLFSKLTYKKIVIGAAMAAVLAAMAIAAYTQTTYWKNSTTLFSHALEVTKNNYIAHYSLGEELRKQDNPAAAIEHYKKALQIKPDYADATLSLGCAFGQQGNIPKALEYLEKTLQLKVDPMMAAYAHNNIGVAQQEQGKSAEAFANFTAAVQLYPDFADARNNLADALVRQGRLEEALEQFRAAFRLRPNWIEPMNNFAWLTAVHPEIKKTSISEAIGVAKRACELTNYKNPTLLAALAASYAASGRFRDAVNTANTALALPDIARQPELKNTIQYHLTFYNQGKPYTEPPAK